MLTAIVFALTLLTPPSVGDINFRDAGTVTASSSAGSRYAPTLAFDGDRSTRWSTGFKERTGWLQVAWDRPRSVDSVTIVGEGPELKGMPGTFRILYLEKERWRTALSHTNEKGPEITLRFDPVSTRSLRLQIDSVVNTRWSPTVAELRYFLRDDEDGKEDGPGPDGGTASPPSGAASTPADAARPAATASTFSSPRYAPAMAVDGSLETKWWAERGETSGWLALEYAAPREFNFLAFDADVESGYGVPRAFRLEVQKGKRWKPVLTVTDGEAHFARHPFKKAKGTRWRLSVESVINSRYSVNISEIRLSLEEDPARAAALLPPPPPSPSAKRVRDAISRGRDYLAGKQGEDGSWDLSHKEKYPMGVAALGALTLLKSGMKADDAPVARTIRVITSEEPKTVYGTALALMALAETESGEHAEFFEKGARFLVETQDGSGSWGYPDGRPDHSNAQYALLGLHAAAGRGVNLPDEVWVKAARCFLRNQQKDGGWNYVPTGKRAKDQPTGSMTAAGIASLLLARHHAKRLDEKAIDAAVAKGFAWLADRFTVRLNPQSPEGLGHYYYLYGLERVGQFGGKTRIGRHGWYGEGAAHLCRFQRRNGGWQESVVDTCFALLFLTQSSRPLSGG